MTAKVTGQEIAQVFQAQTGFRLFFLGRTDLRATGFGILEGWEPDAAARARYGEFLFVVEVEDTAPGTPSNMAPPDQPSEDERAWHRYDPGADVYWSRHDPERGPGKRYWAAEKFRRNVKLIWFNDGPSVDERWHELDAVLEAAAG